MSSVSNTRLYEAAIAFASGIYSIASALDDGMGMTAMSGSFMLLLGVAVIAHGIALLTPLVERLSAVSGPLMIGRGRAHAHQSGRLSDVGLDDGRLGRRHGGAGGVDA